jgi:hypothetical protein
VLVTFRAESARVEARALTIACIFLKLDPQSFQRQLGPAFKQPTPARSTSSRFPVFLVLHQYRLGFLFFSFSPF